MANKKTILEYALMYFKMGISTVPAYYKGKSPPKNFDLKKYLNKPITEQEINELFGNISWCNISAITGSVSSGLTAVDFDSDQLYLIWKEKYPEDADRLPTSKTASGYHVFCRSELTKDDTASFNKIDFRAGGLITFPPSTHETGFRYKWIKPLPENVCDLPLINLCDWKLDEFPDGNDDNDGNEGKDGNEGGGGWVGAVNELSVEAQTAVYEAIVKTLPSGYGQRYNLLEPSE